MIQDADAVCFPREPPALNSYPATPDPNDLLRSDPWRWWRDQMPIADRWAYLDHAAVAPISGPAQQAIAQYATEAAALGDTVWPRWSAGCDQLRKNFARLLGCHDGQICLVPNTTTGINLVAEGFPWQPGDNVVIPSGEFPSNLFPWLNQQPRGVEVRIVPRVDGQVRIDDLIAHADHKTRIIAVSWVGYASGFRIDVEQLVERAHQRGALVFLDAIQGLGMYPLDLATTPVDFLAADGHKWLLGPEGAGIAYIRAAHIDKLRCGNVGWNSVKNSHNYADPAFELRSDATRFESGSANMVGNLALSASLDLFLSIRSLLPADAISSRVIELASQLDQSLQRLGAKTRLPVADSNRSGIVTFELPGVEPNEIRRLAAERNVVVSCRDGGVRASIHAYNHQDDLSRLVAVVQFLSAHV
jgi:selenocysteine lyase/cysteine desulfurase